MPTPNIKSFNRIIPMIYAYTTPGIPYHEGWIKIGYTESQSVKDRIAQQTHTADIRYKLEWQNNALYSDGSGEYFTDHDFHRYLTKERLVKREPNTEWFELDAAKSKEYFYSFASRETPQLDNGEDYILRTEQAKAVEMTKNYFESGGREFLWNAKPRFGKTLTAYDLVRKMGLKKVLIVTNRPSIANSWAEDFNKFIGWRGDYCFVSDNDSVKDKQGVLTRKEYADRATDYRDKGMVAFESLQGLKGSVYFGGEHRKLEWMAKEYTDENYQKHKGMEFDLLIIDEAQEGIDTVRTEHAFKNIARKYTLYLSGTPFKALASEQFADNQIYNWSYADEQEAKLNWQGEDYNPYENLPKLEMYTYQLSNMIYDKISRGIDLSDDETVDYAFDLNEFFATDNNGKFLHEDEIKKFLHALVTQEKYPFSTPQLRRELSHTLWILNRVDSAKALAKLLKEDEVFGEYEIVIAAGDGKLESDTVNEKAFDRVKSAIATNEKTITLSVGQLTVGVTIPEWSGVLMLCNLQSPSSYMQAAFRAQNPCVLTVDGQRLRKETAYVFDFDPSRTLIIFDEFANNLTPSTVSGKGTSDDRKGNIKRLLNFFPVLGEDNEGKMVELDAAQVLSIPRSLKSQEVVRRGFMSNFLFKNISNVFGAPSIVREIVEKLTPAHEEPKKRDKNALDGMDDVRLDDDGNVEIPNEIVIGKTQDLFGEKYYEEIGQAIAQSVDTVAQSDSSDELVQSIDALADTINDNIKSRVVAPIAEDYAIKKSERSRLERDIERDIDSQFDSIKRDYLQKTKIAKSDLEEFRNNAQSEADIVAAENNYKSEMDKAMQSFMESAQQITDNSIKDKPQEVIERIEKEQAQQEMKTVEDSVRDHLRGFSRTIPSFIMAYDDGELNLANFDDYTEDDVFAEVTGITEDDFRFLRDGGDYTDPDTGETLHFDGHLFDEVVFDDSIKEFRKKKDELANYFDESKDEDIFDYIPPQKTNQIFTPKWVVSKMVDELEENNPGCFDDPDNTFADLYMKSGLYITEIVKRLYRSENMKRLYPDNNERIRHILQKQVYGMAPTRIIYLIATNYILGFDKDLKSETKNFVEADAAEAAKNNTLSDLVNEYFDRG